MVESVIYLLPVVPFGDATAPNVSFQLAAIDQKGVVGIARMETRRGRVLPIGYINARERREGRNGELPGKINKWRPAPKATASGLDWRGAEDR